MEKRDAHKCSKCIDYYREKKRRFELINDLKGKSESLSHARLKSDICHFIREFWKGKGFPISVDTEVPVEGIGKVDVLGRIGESTIAVECGTTNQKKIEALKKHFDVVLHIPYCYTWEFLKIDWNEVERRIFAQLVLKQVVRESGIKGETRKPICLEEGECSLPSGRDGYPEEAIEIACSTTEVKQEHDSKY
jgi:hypothetical protein